MLPAPCPDELRCDYRGVSTALSHTRPGPETLQLGGGYVHVHVIYSLHSTG